MKKSIKILLLIMIILFTVSSIIFAGIAINSTDKIFNVMNTDTKKLMTAEEEIKLSQSLVKQQPEKQSNSKTVSAQLSTESDKPKTASSKESVKTKLPLEGLTICIDAGHGITSKKSNLKEPLAPNADIMKAAVASGTCGISTKITEASLNLSVSQKLKKALTDKGANILMVRESERCDLTNVERTKLWNSSDVDFTIRIHANGMNDSKVSGALMMVPGDKYIKNKEMIKKSAVIGEYIFDGVLKHTKAKSRGTIISNDLTGFNWSEVPVVLLEMGFMTNPEEDRLLNTDSYQNKIVAGIVEGVEKYQATLQK